MRTKMTILFCALGLALTQSVSAADMPAMTGVPPAPAAQESSEAATKSYPELRASLLALRARFDVIGFDDIADLLAGDARQIGPEGPKSSLVDLTLDQLRAEGSY